MGKGGVAMYKKFCERCQRPSFSSSETGEWKCPVCRNDLTNLPYFDAIKHERIYVKRVLLSEDHVLITKYI